MIESWLATYDSRTIKIARRTANSHIIIIVSEWRLTLVVLRREYRTWRPHCARSWEWQMWLDVMLVLAIRASGCAEAWQWQMSKYAVCMNDTMQMLA